MFVVSLSRSSNQHSFCCLALNGLAIHHYREVLRMAEESRSNAMEIEGEEVIDFAASAAYNLRLIHVTMAEYGLARAVAKKWLSV